MRLHKSSSPGWSEQDTDTCHFFWRSLGGGAMGVRFEVPPVLRANCLGLGLSGTKADPLESVCCGCHPVAQDTLLAELYKNARNPTGSGWGVSTTLPPILVVEGPTPPLGLPVFPDAQIFRSKFSLGTEDDVSDFGGGGVDPPHSPTSRVGSPTPSHQTSLQPCPRGSGKSSLARSGARLAARRPLRQECRAARLPAAGRRRHSSPPRWLPPPPQPRPGCR